MPNPGRIRITKNSTLTTPLLDYRGAANNFIAWDGQFQITEFANDQYIEYDFIENEWYFNLYATLPGTNLANLLDVQFGTLVDMDVLVYDNITGKWINSNTLQTAIQDIASIENEIATINQTNTDQQTSIDTINTEITTINTEISTISNSTNGSLGGSVPEGGIIMWSGSVVPNDWVLCDGQNSTPDLVDRFIIGSTPSIITSGGAGSPKDSISITQNVLITKQNLPNHTHGAGTLVTDTEPDHKHPLYLKNSSGDGDRIEGTDSDGGNTTMTSDGQGGAGSHSHAITGETSNGNFDNEPLSISFNSPAKKYYALAFIMRRAGFINTSQQILQDEEQPAIFDPNLNPFDPNQFD